MIRNHQTSHSACGVFHIQGEKVTGHGLVASRQGGTVAEGLVPICARLDDAVGAKSNIDDALSKDSSLNEKAKADLKSIN